MKRNKLGMARASFAGFAVAVGLTILSLIVRDVLKMQDKIPADIIVVTAILCGLFVDRWYAMHEQQLDKEELNEILKMIQERLQRTSSFEFVGPSDRIPFFSEEKLKTARRVKNTFVQLGTYGVDEEYHERIIGTYQEVLKRPNTSWSDIVSPREAYDGRYNRIFADKGAVCAGRHEVVIIRHNIPLINFILISDAEGFFRDVYFGWVLSSSNTVSPTFHSSDERLIKLFDDHFELLWHNKRLPSTPVVIDYKAKNRLALPGMFDRSGYWMTIAYRDCGVSGSDRFVYRSAGLLRFTFSNDGTLLEGIIHHKSKIKETIKTGKITQTPRHMYFEYLNDRSGLLAAGFCTYEFVTDLQGRHLRGFFVSHETKERVELIGLPVEQTKGEESLKLPFKDSEFQENRKKVLDLLATKGIQLAGKD